MLKAISLYNPHALLVAIGEKQWETRSRKLAWRGELAIHAGLSTKWHKLILKEPFTSALDCETEMPAGAVIAVVTVAECIATLEWVRRHVKKDMPERDKRELAFGNYSAGRFAWKLENLRRLARPVPCGGRQFIFHLDNRVEQLVREQL